MCFITYDHVIKHIFHCTNVSPPFPDFIVLSSCFTSYLPDRKAINDKSGMFACNLLLMLISKHGRRHELRITKFHKRLLCRMHLCFLSLQPSMELNLHDTKFL
ncbi:hypothetical protein XENOCAPTIV_022061 [Xenoophorus captivus]|uniref:Uncharacterized protein n=1 Tax=Xenoophorus captivus TaxID=1517983 RepID=A0ABV0RD25_9TELE